MIEGLKPYAEYKESGLPWLGSVPSHWDVKRLKNWVTMNEMTLPESTHGDFEFDYLDIGSVGTGRLTTAPKSMRFSGSPSRARRVIRPGDTIVSTVRTYLKAVLTVGVSKKPLIASTGFAVLTPRGNTIPQCLGYVIQSQSFTNGVTAESVGIAYPAISETKLANIPVTLPPPDEQAAIVRFLDHANRKIDGFIRAKRKLIGLLNEQKQAIIHRAVTGKDEVRMMKDENGNPSFHLQPSSLPKKPSGIPWLGDIPAHWEVVRSRRLFTVRTELARAEDVQLSATQSYGVIPQAEYEAKIGRRVVKISMHLEKRKHVEKDDFVISMRSFQGGIERAWASGAIRSSYVVMTPDPCVDVIFFSYVLKSPGYIRALQATGDFIRDGQDLTYGNFRMVDLPLMPLPEQKEIAAYIESATKALEASITRTEREIALMQEYRTRLMADVVTGKLDVREAAAKLPAPAAAADPDEPLEESEPEEANGTN